MSRKNLAFASGLIVSFLAIFLVGEVIVTVGMEQIHREALESAPSPAEYRAGLHRRAEPVILFVAVVGGFVVGALCSMYAGKTPAGRTAPGSMVHWLADSGRAGSDQALTPAEFERVRQSCLFVNVYDRSTAYIQGVIVGRLADTAPELAAKVDRFSEAHMEVIRREIVDSAVMG
jgi:hypothetical protein